MALDLYSHTCDCPRMQIRAEPQPWVNKTRVSFSEGEDTRAGLLPWDSVSAFSFSLFVLFWCVCFPLYVFVLMYVLSSNFLLIFVLFFSLIHFLFLFGNSFSAFIR